MQKNSMKLSAMTIFLHWLIAITIIILIAAGLYMSEYDVSALYPIHKSIGVILFIFILYRAIRRLIRGWPEPVGQFANWELIFGKIVHWTLLIGTLLFPISGMMMSAAGGFGIKVFGLELFAENINAAGKHIPINKTLAGLGHETHEILGTIMIIVIILHILAALKHHFVVKDNTLKRMLGK